MYVAKINESVVGASHEDEEDIVFDEDFDDGDLEVDDVRMIWCVCVCVCVMCWLSVHGGCVEAVETVGAQLQDKMLRFSSFVECQ